MCSRRLRAQGDPATVALVGRLQQDHLQMESRWREARQVLDAVASGALQALSPQTTPPSTVLPVSTMSTSRAEEGLVYPAAAALLDEPTALAAMGQEMMRRRGAA